MTEIVRGLIIAAVYLFFIFSFLALCKMSSDD